jgi:glycosyltransferase involved in cell wall biosynthesis/SAM-dependent methyltransferase
MPFDGNTIKERSLGGSESAGLYMAQALARKGQHLTVFCNTDTASEDEYGVRYIPAAMFPGYVRSTAHDICIIQRAPEMFATVINSKLNIMWCHDLALGRQATMFKSALWNVDGVMVLSDFMKEQYKTVYGLPDSLLIETRNGIDTALCDDVFSGAQPTTSKRIMYCARPERGLDILLKDIMPRIWKKDPDIQLRVATYDNTVPHMAEYYNHLRAIGDSYGEDKVVWLGGLTKRELYRELSQTTVYAYPTPSPISKEFSEVSCIAAMEAQAMGVPIVTSKRGALLETVAKVAGTLIEGDPWTDAYQQEFSDAVLGYFENRLHWSVASQAGIARAEHLGWDDVADDWLFKFEDMIRDRNDDTERLVRHAWRNSDIMMAREIVDELSLAAGMGDLRDELDTLIKPFSFAWNGDEAFAAQYAKIGETHNADVFEYIKNEARFGVLVDWLKEREDIDSVLDYGCGLGGYAYHGSVATGKKFTGVDIDPRTIEIARSKSALQPIIGDVNFIVGTHSDADQFGAHDALLVQELLEHVPEPWSIMNALEKCVKDDGWVYITVPFGPWEYTSYFSYPHRCHIWHFDMHDLRDMFGDKKDFQVDAMMAGGSEELGTSVGWWIVKYRKTEDVQVGKIDMQRKRWLQRPRQTVSVSMMAGPNSEDNLHWCLKSLKHIADEIVLVDNGMGDESLRIANQYDAKIVPGSDPRINGFEVPRNIGLNACHMDWVMWIDTDERLINQVNVQKYLRKNMFNGYGIRQHHFACDTTFSPDTPVRLFRKNAGMRFFGMIHEHPELALNSGPGSVIVMADAHIAHVGYLIESTRQQRFVRNFPLLQKDQEVYPDRILQKHFMMRDNVLLCRFELEQNGGRVTKDIERRCREVIQLHQQYFVGKNIYMGADSLQYYSDALAILGEGFEVAWQFDAGRDRADPNVGAVRCRFATKEDFVAESSKRVEEKLSVLVDPYY